METVLPRMGTALFQANGEGAFKEKTEMANRLWPAPLQYGWWINTNP